MKGCFDIIWTDWLVGRQPCLLPRCDFSGRGHALAGFAQMLGPLGDLEAWVLLADA